MTYRAVTTCHAAGWEAYGRNMARSYVLHWPFEVPLTVYAEGFIVSSEIVYQADLYEAAPWLEPWKAAHAHIKPVDFRTDAVRFSHKVAAIGAEAERGDGVLIWLDADTLTHSPVTVDWLDSLFPQHCAVAWLDRWGTYPECGFVMFRLPEARPIIREVVRMYQSEEIFKLPETHDSYVIQQVVEAAQRRGDIQVASLSGDAKGHGHPFINGPIGSRMDHLKGKRKDYGKSPSRDLMRPRKEEYWRA